MKNTHLAFIDVSVGHRSDLTRVIAETFFFQSIFLHCKTDSYRPCRNWRNIVSVRHYSETPVRVTCRNIPLFFTPIKTGRKSLLAKSLFHTLWNDLSTIARCRLTSISKNQITLYNLERNIGPYEVENIFIKMSGQRILVPNVV